MRIDRVKGMYNRNNSFSTCVDLIVLFFYLFFLIQDGLKFRVLKLLLQSPKCWDYRYKPPSLAPDMFK